MKFSEPNTLEKGFLPKKSLDKQGIFKLNYRFKIAIYDI